METKALYEATERKNVKEIVYHMAKEYNESTAFVIKHKNKDNIKYENISYKGLLEDINGLGTEYFSMGLNQKRIAVIGKNRYEWVLAYLTNLLGGIVSVPLDKDLPLEELESSLIRSKADVIVFDPKLQEKLETIKKNGKTNLTEYICMDKIHGYKSILDLVKQGKEKVENGDTKYIDYEIDENAMNILLFTSGTTSKSSPTIFISTIGSVGVVLVLVFVLVLVLVLVFVFDVLEGLEIWQKQNNLKRVVLPNLKMY